MHKNYMEEMILKVLKNQFDKIYTSFPAIVTDHDPELQQVTVKPAIDLNIDLIVSVPVAHVGGDWCVVTQIDKGTEGMISVCMSDISAWMYGDVNVLSARKFNVSDSFFIPGLRSEANALQNVENNGVQLRNKDGSQYIWLKNDGTAHFSGKIFAEKGAEFTEEVTINKKLTVNDEIEAAEDITAKGEVVTRLSHTHKFTGDEGYQGTTQGAKQ